MEMRPASVLRDFRFRESLAILKYLRYPRTAVLIFASIVAAMVFTLTQLAMPWIIRGIIDTALTKAETHSLAVSAIKLIVIAFVSSSFMSLHSLSLTILSEGSLRELRSRMLAHLQRLPIPHFDAHHSAKLASLFTEDAPGVVKIYHPLCSELILGLTQLVSIFAVVSVHYGKLVLLSFILIPIYVVIPLLTARASRKASSELMESKSRFNSTLQEGIEGIREIKALTRETWSASKIGKAAAAIFVSQIRLSSLNSLTSLNYTFYWVTMGLLYWYCGLQVVSGRITIGELIALVWYLGLLDIPARRFIALSTQSHAVGACAERILEFLRLPTEDLELGHNVQHLACSIEFRKVRFRYPGQTEDAIKSVSFIVPPGMKVAIVGPSGSGKSTITRLLLRFYDPQEGMILLDGIDFQHYSIGMSRVLAGAVFQEPFMFSGTIRENLQIGSLESDDNAIIRAAKIANAHGFIEQLPQGYDTEIGERGARLSVGQKQRIAIARVVLRNPSILIWDEATSSLDAESERAVRKSMGHVMLGRTTFVIAHDLRTVLDCDMTMVLNEGNLVGWGRHEELLRECPLYARLCAIQFDKVAIPVSSACER
jgi:ABC-type multidrug transport system fused ATPase/permease subunit